MAGLGMAVEGVHARLAQRIGTQWLEEAHGALLQGTYTGLKRSKG